MDAITQEETEAMFTKITSVLDYLRNQLVNNTELAKQVQTLQQQVASLTSQIDNVVGQNSALQEAVNVLTKERDDERETNRQLQEHNRDLQSKFEQRDNDANHWYAQHQAVSEELNGLKVKLGELEDDHLRLIDAHEQAKKKLESISSLFSSTTPAPLVEPVPVHEDPQPRDPLTQQWRSWQDRQTG